MPVAGIFAPHGAIQCVHRLRLHTTGGAVQICRDTVEIPINSTGYTLISIPLDKEGNGRKSLSLYKPETTEQGLFRRQPVLRSGETLADLVITVSQK